MKILNKYTKSILTYIVASSLALSSVVAVQAEPMKTQSTQKELRLWYDKPAPNSYSGWENWSLPIGNGHMGASIFGGIDKERLQFNEKTLWSGGPSPSRPDYRGGNKKVESWKKLDEIRGLMFANKVTEAKARVGNLTGISEGYGAYQNFGDIILDFKFDAAKATNYVRDLDLDKSLASVTFTYEGTKYSREYFMSYPDNVMVMKLTADKDEALTFDVSLVTDNSDQSKSDTTKLVDNTIVVKGMINDNGMEYEAQLKVIPTGGTINTTEDGKYQIKDADSVVMLMSAGTDYKQEYPTYRGEDPSVKVAKRIADASKRTYEELYQRHFDDYNEIFARVELDLNHETPKVPTDILLKNYKQGIYDKALEVLYFQYGRYLMISSSREGSLPANLQGVWNAKNNPPWSSDYHMNVNLQMNYWPSYVTNMAETAIPLVEYVESLREPGRVTAAEYGNIVSDEANPENGWMAHTQNTPFGWTCPGWDYYWGWSPAANAWIGQNVWEYYEFTGDKDYLREMIYPTLKEAAVFWNQFLIYDEGSGRWVSNPTYSPEHGTITIGNTFDQELVWQLFTDVITASEELGVDQELRAELEAKRKTLDPLHVGSWGQIKEWYEEDTPGFTDTGQKGHRHISHLVGLYPGKHITKDTPEFFEAAKVTLNDRGDAATGWARAHKLNLWARLLDGDRSYKLFQGLLQASTLDNLWDTHAPFQIDGNFGGTSGVAEMLLQSHLEYIQILPALPSAWSEGSIRGLRARGGIEVDIAWIGMGVEKIQIKSDLGNTCKLEYPGIGNSRVTTLEGEPVDVAVVGDNNMIQFETDIGGIYVIDSIPSQTPEIPQGLTAIRTAKNTVELSWDEASYASSYTVYRKTTGEFEELVSGVTDTRYVDNSAWYRKDTPYRYAVMAVNESGGSEKSSEAIETLPQQSIKVDDRDPAVRYTGAWGKWNQSDRYEGTDSYSKAANAFVEFTFNGTGIRWIGIKNTMDGIAKVYIDDEFIEAIDCYNPVFKSQTVNFSKEDLPNGEHTIKIVVTGEKNPKSGGTQIVIDAFEYIQAQYTPDPSDEITPRISAPESVTSKEEIEVIVSVDEITEPVYSQDITLKYDPAIFKFNKIEEIEPNKMINSEDGIEHDAAQGTIRVLGVVLDGKGLTNSADLFKFNFTGKEVPGDKSSSIIAQIKVATVEDSISKVVDLGEIQEFILVKGDGQEPEIGDNTALVGKIGKAKQLVEKATIGSEPGNYPQSAVDTLSVAKKKAQKVVDNKKATQAEIDRELASLSLAIEVFKKSVVEEGGSKLEIGDVNEDGKIDIMDLALVAYHYRETSNDANWNNAKKADSNGDGKIDIEDIILVARKILDFK